MEARRTRPFNGGDRAARAGRRTVLRACISAAACGLLAHGPVRADGSHASRLERPRDLRELLQRSRGSARPIVALFSTPGCGWCEAIRREQLASLAREQAARGVLVAEFDLLDDRAFDGLDAQANAGPGPTLVDARSPAALARTLGVRVAPTLVFLGPDGEVAERLVGYSTPEFFSAYLEERIGRARLALASPRRTG